MYKWLNTKKGFSLVELMIVVVVMGVLLAIAIPSFGGLTKASNRKICNSQLVQVRSEAKNWCIHNNWNTEVSYAISSDENGNRIFLNYHTANYTLGLSDDQRVVFSSDVHPNVNPCPSGGTYYVKVLPGMSGIPEIDVFCDCEDHNTEARTPEAVMPLAE